MPAADDKPAADTKSSVDAGRRGETSAKKSRARAVARVKEAPARAPRQPESRGLAVRIARALDLENRGMLEQAEAQYRSILKDFPNDPTTRFSLNRVRKRLSTRREQQNKDIRLLREAGLSKFRRGDYSGAVNDLSIAAKAGLTDTSVLYALGMAYLKTGRLAEAQSALNSCLAATPNYAPAIVGLAQVKARAGRNDQAVALLRHALVLGGGAEYSPDRIREMISHLASNQQVR